MPSIFTRFIINVGLLLIYVIIRPAFAVDVACLLLIETRSLGHYFRFRFTENVKSVAISNMNHYCRMECGMELKIRIVATSTNVQQTL